MLMKSVWTYIRVIAEYGHTPAVTLIYDMLHSREFLLSMHNSSALERGQKRLVMLRWGAVLAQIFHCWIISISIADISGIGEYWAGNRSPSEMRGYNGLLEDGGERPDESKPSEFGLRVAIPENWESKYACLTWIARMEKSAQWGDKDCLHPPFSLGDD